MKNHSHPGFGSQCLMADALEGSQVHHIISEGKYDSPNDSRVQSYWSNLIFRSVALWRIKIFRTIRRHHVISISIPTSRPAQYVSASQNFSRQARLTSSWWPFLPFIVMYMAHSVGLDLASWIAGSRARSVMVTGPASNFV